MIKTIITAVLATTLWASCATAAEIGKPAPAFEVKDIEGHKQSLAQYKGKIVVLEWTNPGCPFVRRQYDLKNMQKLQQYALDKSVIWLSVNSSAAGKEGYLDAAKAKAQIATDHAVNTAYILDPEGTLGKLYGAKATPHMFVVDGKGVLAYEGAIDSKPSADPEEPVPADNYVKSAIDALLAGKAVATAQTRAYGCSVKYKD